MRIWDSNKQSGALVSMLSSHTDVVSCVLASFDGTELVSGSWDTRLRVWGLSQDTGSGGDGNSGAGGSGAPTLDWSGSIYERETGCLRSMAGHTAGVYDLCEV